MPGRAYKQARKLARRQATKRVPRSAFSESFQVHQNHHGKTCIEIARANHAVRFIPLDVDVLRVEQKGAESFKRDWHVLDEYPVERAAVIYCTHAQLFGANDEAWAWLQQIITRVTVDGEILPVRQDTIEDIEDMAAPQKPLRDPNFQQELNKATTGRTSRTAAAAPLPPPPAPTRRTRASATANGAVTAPQKPVRQPRGPSASSLFKELIMGTMIRGSASFGWTDDEIFAEVQTQYGLGEERRNYVAWYRNDLKKKGQNPPEAIKAAKTSTPAATNGTAPATRQRRQPAAAVPSEPAAPRQRAPRRQPAGA